MQSLLTWVMENNSVGCRMWSKGLPLASGRCSHGCAIWLRAVSCSGTHSYRSHGTFIVPPVGIVLMTTWASEAVSLGRYSSLLVMTLGKTAYSLYLASVSFPQKREQ